MVTWYGYLVVMVGSELASVMPEAAWLTETMSASTNRVLVALMFSRRVAATLRSLTAAKMTNGFCCDEELDEALLPEPLDELAAGKMSLALKSSSFRTAPGGIIWAICGSSAENVTCLPRSELIVA